jgi:flagellar biogenesis protein FliO
MAPRGPLSGLARIWSWLHSKYTKSAGKRLRLSEVVSLGDKRFVALVKVEDREFLVGGASSGLSLLAQLEKTSEPAHGRKRGIGGEGHSL